MPAAPRTRKKRRTAFILGGGASRGAYQAGCLKRLEEEGIVPDLVIGSSIGVCNSLVYATGGAEALWGFWSRAVALPQVLDISIRRNPLTGNSFFSMGRLQRFVESEVDFDKCFQSETELAYVVTNLSAGHEEMRGNRTEPDVERFKTVTRIGYAIPILHPLIELDGDQYADGGFLWNVPFEYAEDWGATDIYVLSVVPSKLPRADKLRFIPQVAMRMYDIFWRTVGNSSVLEKKLDENGRYHGIDVTILEPSPETGMFDPLGMLNAHPGKSRKLLWTGYRDTEKALMTGQTRVGRVKGRVPAQGDG
jgi:NTE family protein